ncbi:MAG: hypothetical protein ABIE03_02155 [Patescibacteria group bacterium]|nr:hypothetical protein [Patescibacteria group bacterium]
MALTKNDLRQLKVLIKESRDELLTIMFKYFPTKEEMRNEMASKDDLREIQNDISILKDDVSSIRNELDTEHELRLKTN